MSDAFAERSWIKSLHPPGLQVRYKNRWALCTRVLFVEDCRSLFVKDKHFFDIYPEIP
jgi:hypothetical protein